jgi:hypothetical protein
MKQDTLRLPSGNPGNGDSVTTPRPQPPPDPLDIADAVPDPCHDDNRDERLCAGRPQQLRLSMHPMQPSDSFV